MKHAFLLEEFMKKKLIVGLISLIGISASALCIAGCNNETHKHAFTEQVTQIEYLKSNATCTQKAEYYYSCICGETGTQTFESGELNPDNHNFNKKTVSTQFLKSEATCTDKAVYYYSCSCGEIGTSTFEYGQANGHSFKTYTTKDVATCTSDETQIATCENCTSTDIKTIAGTKLPHNFQNAICADCKDSYLKFSLNTDNTYKVDGLKNEYLNLKEVVIPTTYKDIPVTAIADSAFTDCINLEKVTISDGILTIGRETFKNCDSLTSVTIPSTISDINSYAFNGCYRLVEVYNLSSLDITSGSSSNGNIGLYAIDIHSDTSIDSKVVENNEYVFYAGDKNYLIGYKGNNNIIVLPDNYNQQDYEIRDYAFYNKSELKQVTIPDNVTRIGYSAFAGCNKLSNLSIPFIGESRIKENNAHFGYIFGAVSQSDSTNYIPASLTNLTITNEEIILQSAFSKSNYIRSISLSEGLKSIEGWAFFECNQLSDISIPNSVTSIGAYAFKDTAFYNNNANWIDDVLYIDNYLIQARESVSGKYSIKQGITALADDAFAFCKNLTEIAVPYSVKTIGGRAFYSCEKLEKVVLPDSVSVIGECAFQGCEALTTINLPNTINEISNSCFTSCSKLENIVIPNSVISIGNSAFSGCANLVSINLPMSIINIGEGVFSECVKLQSISIPQNVSSISSRMFSGCSSLMSVTFPNNLKSIEMLAFYGCSSLKSLTIPNSVIQIGYSAFYGCSNLTSAIFETTNGWVLWAAVEQSTTKIELSNNDISNPTKAAEYLVSTTYSQYFNWKRSENGSI